MTEDEFKERIQRDRMIFSPSLPSFMYEHRSYNVSQCLDLNDDTIVTPLRENCQYSSLNHPHDIIESIKAFDDSVYIEEALMNSWNIKEAVKHYRDVCRKVVPSDLQAIKMSELSPKGTNEKVIDHIIVKKSEDAFIGSFPYILSKPYEDIVKSIVDKMFVTGYFLAYTDKIPLTSQMTKHNVGICMMCFEKKFSKTTIDLSDVLYHVSPIRYFKKIQKQGIVPTSKTTGLNHPERVYLFNKSDVKQTAGYGAMRICRSSKSIPTDEYATFDKTFVVYAIKKDKLMNHSLFKSGKLVFYIDPQYDGRIGGIQVCEAIFTYGNIPKELIEDKCLVYELQDNETRQTLKNIGSIDAR